MNVEAEHSLVLWLKLSDAAFGDIAEREVIFAIEDELSEGITKRAVGEYDGHEFGDGFARIFMYSSDVDALAAVAIPIVQRHRPAAGSYAVKRYGPPGSRETRLSIESTA